KLVRKAYGLASDQKYLLPTFTTRFDMKNRDFVERIGVTAKETFAPADIELEPDFDLIAEWQDYRVTSRLRLQDLLMDRLFLWMGRDAWSPPRRRWEARRMDRVFLGMEQQASRFKEDLPIKLVGIFGQLSGQL